MAGQGCEAKCRRTRAFATMKPQSTREQVFNRLVLLFYFPITFFPSRFCFVCFLLEIKILGKQFGILYQLISAGEAKECSPLTRASLSHEEAFYSNTNSTAGLPGVIEVTSETTNLDQWCVLVVVLTGDLKTNNLLEMRQRSMAPPGTRTLAVAGHRPRLQKAGEWATSRVLGLSSLPVGMGQHRSQYSIVENNLSIISTSF